MADGFFESRWDSLIWGRNGSDAADQSNGIVAFLVSSAESFDPGPVGRREDLLVPGLRLEEDATDRVRFLPVFTDFDWVLLGFTGFYLVLLGFTGFYWVLLGLIRFNWV